MGKERRAGRVRASSAQTMEGHYREGLRPGYLVTREGICAALERGRPTGLPARTQRPNYHICWAGEWGCLERSTTGASQDWGELGLFGFEAVQLASLIVRLLAGQNLSVFTLGRCPVITPSFMPKLSVRKLKSVQEKWCVCQHYNLAKYIHQAFARACAACAAFTPIQVFSTKLSSFCISELQSFITSSALLLLRKLTIPVGRSIRAHTVPDTTRRQRVSSACWGVRSSKVVNRGSVIRV